jgi:hypothetical protein
MGGKRRCRASRVPAHDGCDPLQTRGNPGLGRADGLPGGKLFTGRERGQTLSGGEDARPGESVDFLRNSAEFRYGTVRGDQTAGGLVMTVVRAALGIVALFGLLAAPIDAEAKAKGRGKNKGANGGGPAFCRSGAGHPVHGWQWCRDKGWDSSNRSIWQTRDRRDDGRVIVLDPRDRDRDRDDDRDDRDDNRRAEPRIRWPF